MPVSEPGLPTSDPPGGWDSPDTDIDVDALLVSQDYKSVLSYRLRGGITIQENPCPPKITASGPQGTDVGAGTHGWIRGVALGAPGSRLSLGATVIPHTVHSPEYVTWGPLPEGVATGFLKFQSIQGDATAPIKTVVGNGLNAPYINGFTPMKGPVGTVVNIIGGNFGGTTRILTLNEKSVAFVVANANTLVAQIPSGASTGRWRFSSSLGFCISADDFVVNTDPAPPPPPPSSQKPIIFGVGPQPLSQKYDLTVSGDNFTDKSLTEVSVLGPDGVRRTCPGSQRITWSNTSLVIKGSFTEDLIAGTNTLRLKNADGSTDFKFTVVPFDPRVQVVYKPPVHAGTVLMAPLLVFRLMPGGAAALSSTGLLNQAILGTSGAVITAAVVTAQTKNYTGPPSIFQEPNAIQLPVKTIPTYTPHPYEHQGSAVAKWIFKENPYLVASQWLVREAERTRAIPLTDAVENFGAEGRIFMWVSGPKMSGALNEVTTTAQVFVRFPQLDRLISTTIVLLMKCSSGQQKSYTHTFTPAEKATCAQNAQLTIFVPSVIGAGPEPVWSAIATATGSAWQYGTGIRNFSFTVAMEGLPITRGAKWLTGGRFIPHCGASPVIY